MKRVRGLREHLSDAQIKRLLEAARDNSQVREAHGVVTQIRDMATKRKVALSEPEQTAADDFDDDIPF